MTSTLAPDPTVRLLDRYLRRIGHTQPVAPTLETLEALCWGQVSTIPFENLDVLAGQPIALGLPALAAKLVDAERGGYCFEQNTLFAAVLEAIGFRVTRLAARVRWMVPPDRVTGRLHMLLRVDLGAGPFIVDVGFGGAGPPGPLLLSPDLEQPTRLERYRLLESAGSYTLQVMSRVDAPTGHRVAAPGPVWQPLYSFTLEEQHAIDYEVANHYMATHPDSHFRKQLVVARCTAQGRLTLRGRELALHASGGPSERHSIDDDAAMVAALEQRFGLRPAEAVMRAVLAALPR
jgi:N-hydroxyarylamine O-acetyltransferase